MTHEHPEQQAAGKALYGDDEMQATRGWDWRADVDALNAYERVDPTQSSKESLTDRLVTRVENCELTAREVRDRYRSTYRRRAASFWEAAEKRGREWRSEDDRREEAERWVLEAPQRAQQALEAQEATQSAQRAEEAQEAAQRAQKAAQRAQEAEEARARREAKKREHEERMSTDPVYRADQEHKNELEQQAQDEARKQASAKHAAEMQRHHFRLLKEAGHEALWEEYCTLEEASSLRLAHLEARAVERAEWHESKGCEEGCLNDFEHEPGDKNGQCFDIDIAGEDDPVMERMMDRRDEVKVAAENGVHFVNRSALAGLRRKAEVMLARYEKEHTLYGRRG